MTPLTIPEYQQILSYLEVNGNYLLVSLYIPGSKYTISPLTKGNIKTSKSENITADHRPEIPNTEAPKYA